MPEEQRARLLSRFEHLAVQAKRLRRVIRDAGDRFEALNGPHSDLGELSKARAEVNHAIEQHRVIQEQIDEVLDQLEALRRQ